MNTPFPPRPFARDQVHHMLGAAVGYCMSSGSDPEDIRSALVSMLENWEGMLQSMADLKLGVAEGMAMARDQQRTGPLGSQEGEEP